MGGVNYDRCHEAGYDKKMSLTSTNQALERNVVQLSQGNGGVADKEGPVTASSTNEKSTEVTLSPPVLADFRYGREDFLALRPPLHQKPPEEFVARFEELFVDLQQPATLSPFSEVEQRLLMGGVNSAKVINAINHVDKERPTRWQMGPRGAPARPTADPTQ
ncbi:unnamed protein product, partial [Soboliphyme baturini]|uniref:Retrotransposon gag protein n=1 Tax=Soboliphyme baturini TaxID=241478 RepID=A0A183IY40_9BILA